MVIAVIIGIIAIIAGIAIYSTKKAKQVLILSIAGVILILIANTVFIIPTGYVGVMSNFGQVSGTVANTGLNFKVPFVTNVTKVCTKQQDITYGGQVWGESSEKTPVYAEGLVITYKINGEKASWIVSNVAEPSDLITSTLVASAVKTAMVTLNAEEVTVRSKVEPLVTVILQNLINEKYGEDVVNIIKVVVSQMDFETSYNEAIAAKSIARQKQEQQEIENATNIAKAEADKKVAIANAEAQAESAKIKAEADAEVAKIAAQAEAEVVEIKAKAEAEANKKLAESLTEEILKKQLYDKWDGKLPEILGGDSVVALKDLEK